MTYSIIIQDHDNKLFERMAHLTGEEENKVTMNVARLQSIRELLNMHTTEHDVDITYLLNKGYTESKILYDQLISEYNSQQDIEQPVRR